MARAHRIAVAALALLLVACATGRADWREASYRTTVVLEGAGDGRCSDPAPYTSFRACLNHDAAYELARRIRCEKRPDPDGLASAQARLAADLELAKAMALDGYPWWWVYLYYGAVRVGAWPSWHLQCPDPRGPP